MKHLILHIGLPKTGSSSLQWVLAKNRAQLEAHDILYPSKFDLFNADGTLDPAVRKRRLTCRRLSEAHHNNLRREFGTRNIDKRKFTPDDMTLEKLESALKHAPYGTIIVSAENLAGIAAGNQFFDLISSLAADTDYRVSVVMFVRSQPEWASSKYTQNAKLLRETSYFAEYAEAFGRKQVVSYHDQLSAWRKYRDAELIALPFTPSHIAPSLHAVFFNALGRSEVVADLQIPDAPVIRDRRTNLLNRIKRARRLRTAAAAGISALRELTGFGLSADSPVVNESPGPMTIAACIHAARQLRSTGEPVKSALCEELGKSIQSECAALGWNREKFNGMTNTVRQRLADRFRDENEAFARTYWGTSWQEVFREDFEQDLQSNEIRLDEETSELREDIARVVGKVFRAHGKAYPCVPGVV